MTLEASTTTFFPPPVIVEEEEPGEGGENRIEELGGGAGVLGAFMGRKGI